MPIKTSFPDYSYFLALSLQDRDMWLYSSVCVRLVPRGNHEPVSVSGIVLVRRQERHILCILNMSAHEIEQHYNVYISCRDLTSDNVLSWIPLSAPIEHSLFDKGTNGAGDELFQSLLNFSHHGFKIIPYETKYNQDIDYLHRIKIVEFSMGSINFTNKFENVVLWKQIELTKKKQPLPITIESAPFSFTNPALFMNFVSEGTINLTVLQDKEEVFHITDVKYLENMAGGVVKQGEVNSVGLVFGNVRKVNGDGDLTLILTWNRIMRALGKSGDVSLSSLSGELALARELLPLPVKSVLAITVEDLDANSLHWGSCLLLDSQTIVTNDHVVNVDFARYKVVVHINKTVKMPLAVTEVTRKCNTGSSKADQIVSPFEGLDIAFLKLSTENQTLLGNNSPVFARCLSKSSFSGQRVSTIGFGLYLPSGLTPLVSTGVVSSVLSLPLYDTPGGQPFPSMIITSSSCWNGSSGGGLFDLNTGDAVGIICSNAQVNVPEVAQGSSVGSYPSKTEKLATFSLCIPIEIVVELNAYIGTAERMDINPRVANAWRLSPTHEEVILDGLKL